MIKTCFDPTLPLLYLQYGRMSDEKQNPRSPDQQFDEICRTKDRQGRDNWIHVKTFRDNGISGRYIRKRPGFSEMLDGIRSGLLKVDLILVDTLERFGRLEDLPASVHPNLTCHNLDRRRVSSGRRDGPNSGWPRNLAVPLPRSTRHSLGLTNKMDCQSRRGRK